MTPMTDSERAEATAAFMAKPVSEMTLDELKDAARAFRARAESVKQLQRERQQRPRRPPTPRRRDDNDLSDFDFGLGDDD